MAHAGFQRYEAFVGFGYWSGKLDHCRISYESLQHAVPRIVEFAFVRGQGIVGLCSVRTAGRESGTWWAALLRVHENGSNLVLVAAVCSCGSFAEYLTRVLQHTDFQIGPRRRVPDGRSGSGPFVCAALGPDCRPPMAAVA